MTDLEISNIKIEKSMWHYEDALRGDVNLRDGGVMVPLSAYAAILISNNDDSISFEEIIDSSLTSFETRKFLHETFSKPWQNIARSLSQEFSTDALRDFVLYYDFNASVGKQTGEFTTPGCITKLALAILDIKSGESVADFGCGYGNFLVGAAGKQPGAGFYGIDINGASTCLTSARMGLLGAHADIETGDMLDCNTDNHFNKIFSNYPFGMRLSSMNGGGRYYDAFRTGATGFGRPASADWIFNQLIFDSLSHDGKAVAIMTNGAAFNGGDSQARRYFLENGMVQAVVALPGNLFRGTMIPTTLIVLGRNDGQVRFVDASDLSIPGRRWDTMGPDEIAEVMRRLSKDGESSRLIDKEELAAAEYSLFPARFIGREIELVNPTPLGELAAAIERGAGLNAKELDSITTDEDTGFSYLRLSDISDGQIGSRLPHIRELDPKLENQCLRTGDLIMSKNGAPFKVAVAEVPDGQTILANGNLYILRLDEERVNPYYVAAFLVSEDGKELMDRMVVGTAIPNLPLKNLKEIEIPLLPLEEQQEIADSYRARLDEIEVLKIKLDKAINGAASAYDEAVGH